MDIKVPNRILKKLRDIVKPLPSTGKSFGTKFADRHDDRHGYNPGEDAQVNSKASKLGPRD
jgi:hypothetical protein